MTLDFCRLYSIGLEEEILLSAQNSQRRNMNLEHSFQRASKLLLQGNFLLAHDLVYE